MEQPMLDFSVRPIAGSSDFTVHTRENNAESQQNLDANRAKFSAKCKTVYQRLMAGERLTVLQCAIDGIASLPRRIKDLREQGIEIADEWSGNIKVYYAPDSERAKYADVVEFMASCGRDEAE